MLFLSTYHNKIDRKGRVSVPAPFRAALASQPYQGIIAYGSFINPCIEACGYERIHTMSQSIDALDPFSEERDAFATTILGGSQQLAFDGDGRVVVPHSLMELAQLEDAACFVGKGATFEIWNPTLFERYASTSRQKALEQRRLLQLSPPKRGGDHV